MPTPLRVLAPVAGVVRGLAEVPDAVFGAGLVGPGLAIEPVDGEVGSPVTGLVVAIRPHAVVVRSGARDVLVHLGVDTVRLDGAGFGLFVTEGQAVRAGDLVVRWDPVAVALAGLCPLCPVVALQADDDAVHLLAGIGQMVQMGAQILDWT